jgi:hypothetical protein
MKDMQLQLLKTAEQRRHLELEAKRRKTSVAQVIRETIAAAQPRARTTA